MFDVTEYGAVGDGVTDDTSAVQAAIDACHAAEGGTIFFPPGIYQISGPMQGGGFNGQLVIPFQPFGATSVAIKFLGAGPNRIYEGEPPGGGEAILRTDWNGAISGHPALLSAGPWRNIGSARSNVQLTFEDLSIIAPDNPRLSALQVTCAASVHIRNVQVRTTSRIPPGFPTHANACGVEMPFGLSYVPEETSNLAILGYYVGLRPSEQTHGTASFAFCTVGVELVGQRDTTPYIRWPNTFPKLTFVSCQRGIKATGDDRWITGAATFEHDPGVWQTVYDIDDPNNYLHGFLTIHPTDFYSGPTDLLVNNAQRLSYHQPDRNWWRLHSQVHVPTGVDPTENPYSGFTLYAANGSGLPAIRTSSGDVYTLALDGYDPPPPPPPGSEGDLVEVDYVQLTSTVSVTATSEAQAQTVLTANTITADGSAYYVEFFAESVNPAATAGREVSLLLFDGNTSLGFLGYVRTPSAGNSDRPVFLSRRLTPSVGTHTYSIKAIVNAGTGTVIAGPGGAGANSPAFLRILRV